MFLCWMPNNGTLLQTYMEQNSTISHFLDVVVKLGGLPYWTGEFLVSHSCHLRLFVLKAKACGHRGASSIVKGHHTSTTAATACSRWTWDALVALEDLDGPRFWESFYRAWKSQTRAPSSTEEMLKRGLGSDDPTPKRFRVWPKKLRHSMFIFSECWQFPPVEVMSWLSDHREILAKEPARSSQGKTCSSAKTQSKPFTNFTSFAKLTLPTY